VRCADMPSRVAVSQQVAVDAAICCHWQSIASSINLSKLRRIRMEMRDAQADVQAWMADTSAKRFSNDECATRFGYRLVVIHPFPNGNGRWSRLAADALVVALGGRRFTWGGGALTETGRLRRRYITALQAADTAGDFAPLMTFARS
jgi:fido (protein-threonine AMPylation protein)